MEIIRAGYVFPFDMVAFFRQRNAGRSPHVATVPRLHKFKFTKCGVAALVQGDAAKPHRAALCGVGARVTANGTPTHGSGQHHR